MDELENGIVKDVTKQQLLSIIKKMADQNQLDGVVLGCTELPLILKQDDFNDLQVLDIAKIHVEACVNKLLED